MELRAHSTTADVEVVRAPTVTGVARPSRLAALDWIRFFAVTLMVQGHTFTEVLVTDVKDQSWYPWHGYVHGFTAPIFYFSSGLAFGVTTLRTWDEHLGWTKPLRKRLERYAILLLIGYSMQAGAFSLRALIHAPAAERATMLAVNTLQNIGMTLLIAELLAIACRTVPRFRVAIFVLTAALVGFAPLAWRFDGSGLPLFVSAYITDKTSSIFPLFPWSGYTLSGILVAMSIVGTDRRSLRSNAGRYLAIVGTSLAAAGELGRLSGWNPFGEHVYWKTSPFFFVFRLGIVILVFAALRLLEERVKPQMQNRGLRTIQTIAQETLVIYVGHLLLLYGTPWTGDGLAGRAHEALSLTTSIVAFLAVLLPMLAFAYVWNGWKKNSQQTFDRVRWAVTFVLVAIYVVNPPP